MAKYTETTGTLTNTTASLAAMDRQGLVVANPSDTVMYVRFGGTASATAGIPVAPNDSICLLGRHAPDASVSIFCAGTSKAYVTYEW